MRFQFLILLVVCTLWTSHVYSQVAVVTDIPGGIQVDISYYPQGGDEPGPNGEYRFEVMEGQWISVYFETHSAREELVEAGIARFYLRIVVTMPEAWGGGYGFTNRRGATNDGYVYSAGYTDNGVTDEWSSEERRLTVWASRRLIAPLDEPRITIQPRPRTNVVGSSLIFAVTAVGLDPLQYMWFKNGVLLPHVTGRSPIFTNVQPSDAGIYSVIVTNGVGFAVSSNVIVAIRPQVIPGVIQGPVTNTANGHAYFLLEQSAWFEAEIAAKNLGGHLATVRNAEEQSWIFNQFGESEGQSRSLWIGLYDDDPIKNYTNSFERRSEFIWTSEEYPPYFNWSGGEPNNYRELGEYYVHMLPPSFTNAPGTWNDTWDVNFNYKPTHGVAEVFPFVPSTHYVDAAAGSPTVPYLTWETAARTLQDAVDVAAPGDLILVTNGVYAEGGRTVTGLTGTNRAAINKTLKVESVNGPAVTVIDGGGTVRCAFLADGGTLNGFTLTNGRVQLEVGSAPPTGAGLHSWASGIISNCIFANNWCDATGGGARGGTYLNCQFLGNRALNAGGVADAILYDCSIIGNAATNNGGGSLNSVLYNCSVWMNESASGGGALGCELHDCTVLTNAASSDGGGASHGTNYNCLFTGNTARSSGGGANRATLYDCILVGNRAEWGGALSLSTCSNCVVTNNSCSSGGGGLFGSGAVNSTIAFNFSEKEGGGTFASGIENCTIYSNQCSYSGGGSHLGYMKNSVVFNNRADLGEGGGAAQCSVSECIITNNYASSGGGMAHGSATDSLIAFNLAIGGGGTYGSSVFRCIIKSNHCSSLGGGSVAGTLRNCVISGNQAPEGGGAANVILENCTIVGNTATWAGGGGLAWEIWASNCIVYDNIAVDLEQVNYETNALISHSCTFPLPPGAGNFTNSPGFVDLEGGNFRLSRTSPCIDAGVNLSNSVPNDFDGEARPLDGNGDGTRLFDVGAFEFNLMDVISPGWFVAYGLNPDDPDVLSGNPDNDGQTTFQEWIADTDPTNAQSYLHIKAISINPGVSLYFRSSSNRVYTLDSSLISTGFWQVVSGQIDIPGNGGLQSLRDVTGRSQQFYRVRVKVPGSP